MCVQTFVYENTIKRKKEYTCSNTHCESLNWMAPSGQLNPSASLPSGVNPLPPLRETSGAVGSKKIGFLAVSINLEPRYLHLSFRNIVTVQPEPCSLAEQQKAQLFRYVTTA
jgi:hypothetical protein